MSNKSPHTPAQHTFLSLSELRDCLNRLEGDGYDLDTYNFDEDMVIRLEQQLVPDWAKPHINSKSDYWYIATIDALEGE